ncbi:MAG: hypothetical protein J6T20_02265 [Treponema sp.]|nr:hypothetical protein [Treponema sp.]
MKIFKNRIRFSHGIIIFLTAAVLSTLSFFSCEVGLGGAVDTQPPKITITNPPVDAVIRDNFAICGTYDDDGTIASVTAVLSRPDGRGSSFTFTTFTLAPDTENRGAGIWKIPVYTIDSNKNKIIVDGTYQASITIKDASGRTTIQNTTFTIDNTPPVIVLQRPGTDLNASAGNSDTYGRVFSLEGLGADDNNIDHIDVNIFEHKDDVTSDTAQPKHTVTLSNVPPSISMNVAEYGDENYTAIYGNVQPEDFAAAQFFCTINAYDSAQRYPIDSEVQSAEDLLGNTTDVYYIYEDLSKDILKTVKITELYHIINGVSYLDPSRSASDFDSIKEDLVQYEKKSGSFVLDPKNNPTFSVAGKPTLKANTECLDVATDYTVSNDSDITIQVNVGLDNSPIVDDANFRVYFQSAVFENGKYKGTGPKIYPVINSENGKKKIGSNYQFTVNVKSSSGGLQVEHPYIIGVDGKDQNDQPILAANNGYGFYLLSMASAPTLKDIIPAASTIYVKKDGSLRITGKTTLTEGNPVVSIRYNDVEWLSSGELTQTSATSTNEYPFDITIPASYFNNNADRDDQNQIKSTEFAIEIRSANGGKTSSTYKTVMYDVDEPLVNEVTVSPEIKKNSKYVLNGVVTVKALLEDDFTAVKKWKYEVIQNDNTVGDVSEDKFTSKVEFTIDTTTLQDEKDAVIKITVEDKAGNINPYEIPCFVDQETDKPDFEAQDGVAWYKNIVNPYYIKESSKNVISGSLYSRIKDDDSVKFVKFEVKAISPHADSTFTGTNQTNPAYAGYDIAADSVQAQLDSNVRTSIYKKSGQESSVTHVMPSTSGFYEVTQTVYDANFVCTGEDNGNGNEPTEADEAVAANANYFTKSVYVIKISGNGPQYSLSRDTTVISPNNQNKELKVTISIEGGEPPYTIWRNDIDTPVASNITGSEYIDTFQVKDVPANLTVRYKVRDVNGTTPKEIKYTLDSENPTFTNPKIEPESGTYQVYKTTEGQGSSATDVYYLNNQEQSFRISGLADDNINVENVKLEIKKAGASTASITKTSKTGFFDGIEFKDNTTAWIGGATATITVTDMAGNVSDPITMNLKFDSTAPAPEHKVDDSLKDIMVRVGDYANDLGETDVGGKYSEGTYGNALTIQIRGLFEDNTNGSGINKFYYKVFNNLEVIIDSEKATGNSPVDGTGDDAGKIFFKDKETLKNWIIANKTDTFSPLDAHEKKNVEYNIKPSGSPATPSNTNNRFGGTPTTALQNGQYTVNSKGYVQFRLSNVESNYKTTIKGFKEGKNYLVLVAEDNVGNTEIDCAEVQGEIYPCYSLNVDLKVPTIPSKENDRIYTNIASNAASGQVTISGTISDQPSLVNGVPVPDGSSGIKSIVFTSDANDKKVEISLSTDDDAAALAAKGLERIPTATDPTLMSWNVDVKTLLPTADGSAIITAKVTDNSGYETSVPVANITVDVTAPIITVNSPANSDFTKTSITFTGTANDGSGAGINTTEGLTLYYKTASSNWTAYGTKPQLTGQNWTCTFDASTVAAQEANTALSFRVGAKDKAGSGNQGYSDILTVTVDRAKPQLAAGCTIDSKAIGNVGSSWFKASTLNIKGSFSDVGGSGAKTIKYQVKPGNKTALAEKSVPSTDGGFDINVSGFENGTNTLWIWAVDDVENESVKGTGYTIQVDSQAPTFTQHEDTANYGFAKVHLTNAKANKTLKFYVTESTAESGIADISAFNITIGGTVITPVTGTDGSTIGAPDSNGKRLVTLVIGQSDLANISGYQTVLATVSDKAGNVSNPQAIGILNKDGDPPAVTFTSPEADSVVNKTIIVSGKATDANEITEINLTAKCGTNTKSYTYTKGAPSANNTISYANSIWSVNIDTTQLDNTFWTDDANKKTVTLSITAKDEAGNTSETAEELELVINQNEDRPVITIGSGVDFTKKNGDEIWVKGSSTIYGSVTDDDGISSFAVYKKGSGDANFTNANASYSGGSWNVKLPGDDSYILKFEVTDRPSAGAAATFTSAAINSSSTDAAILATPIIKDAPDSGTEHQFGNTKANGNTLVSICLDTTPPTMFINAISLDKSTWYEDYNKSDLYLGGENDTFYLKVTASDSSGLYGTSTTSGISASFTGSIKETIENTEVEYKLESTDADFEIEAGSETDEFIIKVTGFDKAVKPANAPASAPANKNFSGTLTLTVTAKDKAEMETPKTLSRTIDNTAPVIRISAPNSVSSTAVVSGSIEGETVNPSVYYMLSEDGVNNPDETSTYWNQDSFASLSYNIYFDGNESTTATHTDLFRTWLTKAPLNITSQDAIDNNTYTDMTDVYIWIKAVDICGNTSFDKAKIVVDPQGNRPNVAITYPDVDNSVLGGTIRIMGTANDNVEAKYVWIQLDIDGNGWSTTDYNILKAVTKSSTDTTPYYTFGKISVNKTLSEAGITPSASNIADVGIMVPVSGGSWNTSINPNNELIPSGNSNDITMYVYATDDDTGHGTTILKSVEAVRTFTVDKDTPYFVQNTLRLVQYDNSNNVKASQTYKEGMSVKGQWWLEGEITDDSGINKISLKTGNGSDEVIISSNGQSASNTDYEFARKTGDAKTYTFKVKVGNASGVGKTEIKITAEEVKNNNPLSVYKDFIVYYDNEAPTVAAQDDTTNFKIEKTIKNSQGYYSLRSAAYERHDGDTGVERIAVFFTRTVNGTTYVFDPMYKRTNAASKLATVSSGSGIKLDSEDNLYWGSATADVSSSTLTLSAALASYVHTGGLAKVNGVVYRIESVDATNNKVVLSGEPGDKTGATVFFAVANIVDNSNPESKAENATALTTDYGYGYCNNYIYDDGDMIMENLHKDDSKSWTWELYVNSKNISDGDVQIHYVVFDKAGNSKHDVVTAASVENNKPRLVSVALGVDINQDGNITQDDNEITTYYPEGLTEKPGVYTNASTSINISGITVKGKMSVTPEIVGGNGDLFYQWKTKKTAEWQKVETNENSPNEPAPLMSGNDNYDDADFNNANDYIATGETALTTQTGTISHDIAWLIKYSTDNDTDFNINYEIFDSTDGKTVFTDSNKVSINITGINLQVRDKTAPIVTIDDFYWNSLTDNSVYTSKEASQVKSVADLEGHIELNGDLPASFLATGATDNELDRDDKVSGKIKLSGTVSDNIVLTDLYLTIDGLLSATKVATYDKTTGKWMNGDNSAEFVKVGTLAGTGYEFDIDKASNDFDLDNGHSVNWTLLWDTAMIGNVAQNNIKVQVRADDNAKNAGQTSNFSTTSTRQVDVVPYITGISTSLDGAYSSVPSVFNRSARGYYPVRRGEEITISGFNLKKGNTAPTVVITANATVSDSSKTSVTLAVPTTATSGNVTIKVNGIDSLNNQTSKLVPYNQEANGINNDILTDERKVWVWGSNQVVDGTSIRYPTFKVGSNGDEVFSYDVGGTDTFLYKNGTEYKVGSSFTQWYDTAVAVDESGNLYGLALNGDCASPGSTNYSTCASMYFYPMVPGPINVWAYTKSGSNYTNFAEEGAFAWENTSNGTTYNPNRIQNPKLISDNGSVYSVYYDVTEKEIVFRAGTYSTSFAKDNTKCSFQINSGYYRTQSNVTGKYLLINNQYYPLSLKATQNGYYYYDIGDYSGAAPNNVNTYTRTQTLSDSLKNYSNGSNGSAKNSQTIASGTAASAYSAVAIVPNAVAKINDSTLTTTEDVAVVCWYDSSAKALKFSYNTTPLAGGSWLTTPVVVDPDFAGWYPDMVVDGDGGIHISYYGAKNGDLKYAYLENFKDTTADVCTVDSYLSVGTRTSISISPSKTTFTVGDTTVQKYVPHISYYMSAFTATQNSVRTAWPAMLGTNKTANNTYCDGAVNDKYTGYWEVQTLPLESFPNDYTIGIGEKNDSILLGYGTSEGLEISTLY